MRTSGQPVWRRLAKALGGLALWLATAPCPAQVLFDGAAGSLPREQAWDYVALPGASTLEHTGAGVRLDTRISRSEHAGMARQAPAPLNRTNRFALEFDVALREEVHHSEHRAGFSVIVLDHAARGIELGFWSQRVFAQSQDPLFTHAEDAAWDAGAGLRRFTLTLSATNYALLAEGELLLTGPVRDYSAFAGLFDVYETPDLLFLGDDTGSASAVVEIHRVALVAPVKLTPTKPAGQGATGLSWNGPPGTRFTVEGSPDLRVWRPLATATSASGSFAVLNVWGESGRFLRVRVP